MPQEILEETFEEKLQRSRMSEIDPLKRMIVAMTKPVIYDKDTDSLGGGVFALQVIEEGIHREIIFVCPLERCSRPCPKESDILCLKNTDLNLLKDAVNAILRPKNDA